MGFDFLNSFPQRSEYYQLIKKSVKTSDSMMIDAIQSLIRRGGPTGEEKPKMDGKLSLYERDSTERYPGTRTYTAEFDKIKNKGVVDTVYYCYIAAKYYSSSF